MHLLASTANLCRSAYVAIMNVQKPPRVGPLNNGAMLGWLVGRSKKNRDGGARRGSLSKNELCHLKDGMCFSFLMYIFVSLGGAFSIVKITWLRLLGLRTYSKCCELDLPHGEPVYL